MKLALTIKALEALEKRFSEPHSWCQGMSGTKVGPNCLSGGLYQVAIARGDYSHRSASLELTADIPKGLSITAWNDQRRRTREDVVALIQMTIKRLKAKEQHESGNRTS